MTPGPTGVSAGRVGRFRLPAEQVEVDGEILTITRAWPEKTSSTLGVEAVAADGSIRAGFCREGAFELFAPDTDPRLPRLEELSGHGEVVSHRPRRRAVLRCADDDAGSSFVKLVRPGRSSAILDGLRRAEAFSGPFRTPVVLAADDSSVRFAALAGVGLHDPAGLPDRDGQQWSRAWQEVLAAWREGVCSPTQSRCFAEVTVHTAQDEANVLRRWADLAGLGELAGRTGCAGRNGRAGPADRAASKPDVGEGTFRAAVEAAVVALEGLPEVTPRPAHRDLHDKQVLWSPELGPGLLDVDTACLADPALDLGNLRAHATWRHRQGVWSLPQAEAVRLAVDDTAAELSRRLAAPVEDAVAIYQQTSLLRLVCLYAFRPRYAGLAAQMRGEMS